ncbi:MAG: GNAT family N-acetyltransferase [Bosea sp. (in: a-proteobacteria)]
MSAITVRPIVSADRAAWTPLWRAYLAFYKTELPDAIYDHAFARLTGPDPSMGGFIAERDGQAIGIVHWVLHRTFWSQKDMCYLQDLFTVEAARGSGAGRKLIEAVRERAKQLDCLRVYWQTHESNTQAQALYDSLAEKSGFIVYRQALG